MNLSEKLQKIKEYESDIMLVLVILLVGLVSFGLGRLSALSERKTPIVVESVTGAAVLSEDNENKVSERSLSEEKLYVVSKNGTKYHYPWCSGAQRIKEENKVWFSTKEEAEKAGYTPAANCKGL